jgi:octaprenyl-diphosphate synthase
MFGRDLKIYSPNDFPKDLPRLSDLYDKLFSDGKGFRGQLVAEVADVLSLSHQEKLLLAQTIEFIHNSSLLHDDLIDQAPLRRGKTAMWKEFGPEYAVLAGDYLLARVMVNLSTHGHIKLVQVTSESISELLEGEWLQDSVRFETKVSFEKMQRIHELKTSSLFSWCLKSPFIYKDYPDQTIQKLSEIGKNMGLLLQRSDDLLDFNVRNYEEKSLFTDLKAGFLNSFSIHLFADLKASDQIFKIESEADLLKLISKDQLQGKLKEFDALNEQLIEKIKMQADELVVMQPNLKKLQDMVLKIAPRLYWRK